MILQLSNIFFQYDTRVVLRNVNLSVEAGDFLGIVGPNGSGKSTLLKTMMGLISPDQGEVKLFGKSIKEFREWHRIGYIPQKVNSLNVGFPATVFEVVSMGLTGKKGMLNRLSKADDAEVEATIALVGLQKKRNDLIGTLSGGQLQRVFIARALVSKPDVMIFDEPTVGVDANSMESFYQLLEDLHRHHKKTIVLVSHDIGAITTRVNKVACINRELYYHGDHLGFIENQQQILAQAYQHSITLIEHGHKTECSC
ncbi:hypothetical protein BHU72_04665 [Desulfuribacillus stibiiarsenatis]|uniref:ABC transporter domain-containing protein n=1 Tax=Desulfuribacillus stibiiarsenatis TaxID=1390249 RepID=A0A1E5L5J8_9FIRM|nr:metal ABC transporter ATP-binding protein [Desulfuribacillus stibiiarsenatis]OEH85386.1 hypothetical protein BHU72_04665 [Desulfuribacillus stibiiarsenatis]